MKENKLTFINTLFWIFGALYVGELLIQSMVRLGLEIESYEYYLKLQFAVFLPIGIFAYFVTKTTLSKYLSSLAIVFSVLMINFVLILTHSFDDPWAYVTENREEIIQAFTGNTILILPLLIGFVVAQLTVLLLPKLMKGKSAKELILQVFAKVSNLKTVAQKAWKKLSVKKTTKKETRTTKKKATKSTRAKKSTANAAKKTSRRSKKSK